jgi:hypothetical protein
MKLTKSQPLAPVKSILKTINASENEEEINECKHLISDYIDQAKRNKLYNVSELADRLNEELLKRQEELYLVEIFVIQ